MGLDFENITKVPRLDSIAVTWIFCFFFCQIHKYSIVGDELLFTLGFMYFILGLYSLTA